MAKDVARIRPNEGGLRDGRDDLYDITQNGDYGLSESTWTDSVQPRKHGPESPEDSRVVTSAARRQAG